jgi:hypothetical protein
VGWTYASAPSAIALSAGDSILAGLGGTGNRSLGCQHSLGFADRVVKPSEGYQINETSLSLISVLVPNCRSCSTQGLTTRVP